MHRLDGWLPIRVYWRRAKLLVDWCWLGELRFTDPFFEQTVNQALSHPANLLFRRETPIEALEELAAARPGLRPNGFIFHMSRSGSTLISQMLSRLPQNLVISEASPIDTLLRSRFEDAAVTVDQRVNWLRWLVSVLGQRRQGEQERFFIKFDCWHTLFLPLILHAFPGVPWIFVYRKPFEVLMSQHAQRGAQMIPGVLEPGLFGWDVAAVGRMRLEEYGARVLAKICEAAVNQVRKGSGKLLNYHQLPAVVCPTLIEFWGLDCSSNDAEHMLEAARWNAKNPASLFEDDTARKSQAANEELREVAREWLDGSYRQLEIERQRSGIY
ncbi:MAG TPA: hypothetical protein VNZ64_07860 [Candidatus Acidoferrum sp.]|jgi:hypothetical protein|nr:hypothetical protein [Candidatus Acidoferrum sp.]